MLQNACVLYILTCKCVSRHSGVPFLNIWSSKSGPYPSFFSHFDWKMCFAPTAACHFWTSELQKLLRDCGVLCILTWKCASRHSGVPFFNIGTSKIAPTVWCLVHFGLQMCFAPTAACHFWTSDLQKLLRPCGVLCILACKCASRHSSVPFLNIGTSKNCSDRVVFCAFWLANVLRATAACHFSSVCGTATSAPAALARLLFEHQEPRISEKTQRIATFLTFGACGSSF